MGRSKQLNASQVEYIKNHSELPMDELTKATGLKSEHIQKVLDGIKDEPKPEKPKPPKRLAHFDREALEKGAIVTTAAQSALDNPDPETGKLPNHMSPSNDEWMAAHSDCIAKIERKQQ